MSARRSLFRVCSFSTRIHVHLGTNVPCTPKSRQAAYLFLLAKGWAELHDAQVIAKAGEWELAGGAGRLALAITACCAGVWPATEQRPVCWDRLRSQLLFLPQLVCVLAWGMAGWYTAKAVHRT
eukprot:scaffold102072_cov18-Tisochrysis_lutea.AAC.3